MSPEVRPHGIDVEDVGEEYEDPWITGRRGDYRTYVTFAQDGTALQRIREQAWCWLREHGHDVDLDGNSFQRSQADSLLVLNRVSSDGHDFRIRLTEEIPRFGRWRSALTAHLPSSGDPGWLTVSVRNREGRVARVPRLIGYLLDALPLRDGQATLSRHPLLVRHNVADDIQEILCDPERQGLVFLAGTDHNGDVDAFLERVARVTRLSLGQAFVAVLDPDATAQLVHDIYPSHAPLRWGIRTYYPDVDPAVEADGLRHRFVTARRVAESSDTDLSRLLSIVARGHTADRVLPDTYTTVSRALARFEDRVVLDRLRGVGALEAARLAAVEPAVTAALDSAPVPPISSEERRLRRRLALVENALGLSDFDEVTLTEALGRYASAVAEPMLADFRVLMEEQRIKSERLQEERDLYVEALEEVTLDQAIADEERRHAEDTIRWLRGRLEESEDPIGAYQPVPDGERTDYPESFDEMLARLDELRQRDVVFTGDAGITRALDPRDTFGLAVKAAWDVLQVLADYVRARRAEDWTKDLYGYLRAGLPGYRVCSTASHAPRESEATMNKYGSERSFPVPSSVDESGHVLMEAHFKLARIGMVSPRLYYLDNFSRDGRVYVGYIGPHLHNTQSN